MKTRSFFFAISLTAMASHPLQAREWGVINTCTADVYTEASYTSPVDTQVHLGSLVEIIGKDGIWVKINTGQAIEGWITEKCMTFMTEEKTEEYRNTPKCICTVNCATVWGKAGDDRSRISPS